MQGKCSLSSSSVSLYCGAANAISHLAALKDTEPQHLHDVNQDEWQQAFQSVMANVHDQSPALNLPFGLHDNSSTSPNFGSLSQPLQARVFPSSDTPSHYNSAPPEPATPGPEFQRSPNQDATPAQVQSPRRRGSRPFSCPDCHTYTTDRKYNLNRHRETRHGKRQPSN